MASHRTLVVDNGADTIKAGFARKNAGPDDCSVVPNTLARSRSERGVLVGPELIEWEDFQGMQFRRPMEKGFVVNWDSERAIWDKSFLDRDSSLSCDPKETKLILTEAPNAFQKLSENTDQIMFEGYGFASVYRCVGASLVPWNDVTVLFSRSNTTSSLTDCVMVVDAGYSSTQVIPVVYGKVWQAGVRRLTVGGKFISNYLKNTISTRHLSLMDETYIVDQIKRDISFVSTDFKADLEKVQMEKKTTFHGKHDIILDYTLPDFTAGERGGIREYVPKQSIVEKLEQNTMTLGNERFAGPELLFNPRDIGLKEAGLAETIIQSLESVDRQYWGVLMANVVIVGGCAHLPGLSERLESELRPRTPGELTLQIGVPKEPTKYVWQGGVNLANQPQFLEQRMATKKEYDENGSWWCSKKYAGITPTSHHGHTTGKRRRESTVSSLE